MPNYLYRFTEETVLYITIEANNLTEADELAEDMLCNSDMDWGMGKMETNYLLIEEEKEND
jgi:hypothetical protein